MYGLLSPAPRQMSCHSLSPAQVGRQSTMLYGFQYVKDACHKTIALPSPKPSRTPGPRQHILRLSRRRWLLGPSLPFELAVGCLLHDWRAANGLPCSAYPFRAILGRCFMPGLITSERLSAMCPIDLETFPFWGQPVIRVWLVVHDDTSMHLHLCYP